MKYLKLLYLSILTSVLFTACTTVQDNSNNFVSLESVITDYELWYVDYNRTQGTGDVPFLSRAFTVSFFNGNFYANNNIVDIGHTGNGLGILVGDYYTNTGTLEIDHTIDGYYDFDVTILSNNEIRLDDRSQNVSYYLVGYQRNDFDYNQLFYDNIEFFLQEYIAWERTDLSGGTNSVENIFDEERFLQFTPDNNTTFYSSTDAFGTNVENIVWDFTGEYIVYDVNNNNNLKGLELNYDNGDTETFELTVINDGEIELYHQNSDTYYSFIGKGFIQYLKGTTIKAPTKPVRNSNRKRTVIKRKTVDRKDLK